MEIRMLKLTKPVLTGGIIVGLYVIGTAMDTRRTAARAASGPAVSIGSPIPLPVSGAVSALQSGAWNVGITGTPGVNVTGLPAVTLASGASVIAVNTPSNPLPILDIDSAIRHPYQSTANMSLKCAGQFCAFAFGAGPKGTRLMVEHIT